MQPLQLLQELALLLVHTLRHLDPEPREDVALAGAGEARRAAALDPQQLAVLGAGRHLQRDRPFGRRHLDLAAERGGRERHRHLHDEVVAAPLVDRRRRHAREDDDVARGTAVLAGLALALEPNLRAVLDARLDLHRVRLDAALAARAAALRARLLDHGAVAAAARARLREREQALRLGLDAAAVALRADDRRGAGLRARAAALAAGGGQVDRHLHLRAVQRVLEGEL